MSKKKTKQTAQSALPSPDKFFFAAGDSRYYDDTIRLAVPYYDLAQKTLVEVLKFHFSELKEGRKQGVILDVGAGTGMESLPLLEMFPEMHLLAIDLLEPMREIFEQNHDAKFGSAKKKRYFYLTEDILTLSLANSKIINYLNAVKQKACKVAVSAYCIHHFTLEDKRRVYQKMYDFLEPGGLLVNVDLYTYDSVVVKEQAHDSDLSYIEQEFEKPSPPFAQAKKIPIKIRRQLKKNWLHHMNHDNILHSVEAQLQMLRNIGFQDVECVFKYWQQGIIRGKKPKTRLSLE